ncbi:unnamed protein product [Mycena citricolor]|uniref:Transmembrane protein n=1 Tax=Mycena citricolor TaxID=2018698 RepID=A0AAD2GXQ3_9AGAR|nr:unnamed protein product [Mycena citricolor]
MTQLDVLAAAAGVLISIAHLAAGSPTPDAPLNKRTAQSTALCLSPTYDWMSSSHKLSPCLLSSVILGTCFTGNWNVPSLGPGQGYTAPNATTANLCTCSWTAYNLLSACTACQGFDSAIDNWAAYDASCGGLVSDTYYPQNVTLPAGTVIPSWAGVDPTTWNNGRFDTAQAQALHDKNNPDLVPGSGQVPVSGSKVPTGAIAGGVVGGVVVLLLGAYVAYRLWAKRQATVRRNSGPRPLYRARSLSADSNKWGARLVSSSSFGVSGPTRPSTMYTPTARHTQLGSITSVSYMSETSPSPPRTLSPLPVALHTMTPFPHTAVPPPISRKTSESTLSTTQRPVSVPSSPPPPAIPEVPEDGGYFDRRERINPPAYSASPEPAEPIALPPPSRSPSASPGPSAGHRRDKLSVESARLSRSVASVASMEEVLGSMGLAPLPGSPSTATVATGHSAEMAARHPTPF